MVDQGHYGEDGWVCEKKKGTEGGTMGVEGGMHVEASTAGSSFTSPAWCVSLMLSRAKPGLPDYHCRGVCTCAFVCGNLLSRLRVQPKFNKGCLCSIKTISCRQTWAIMKLVSSETWGNLTAAALTSSLRLSTAIYNVHTFKQHTPYITSNHNNINGAQG